MSGNSPSEKLCRKICRRKNCCRKNLLDPPKRTDVGYQETTDMEYQGMTDMEYQGMTTDMGSHKVSDMGSYGVSNDV